MEQVQLLPSEITKIPLFVSVRFASADLHVTIVQRLKTLSVLEGEDCTFDCLLSHDVEDQPSWTINGQAVATGGRVQVVSQGRKYRLTIKDALLTDSGDIVFTIKDLTCRTVLFVRGEHLPLVGNLKSSGFCV